MSTELPLKDERKLLIALAEPPDAEEITAYLNQVSGESNRFLFALGERTFSVPEKVKYLTEVEGGEFNFMLKGIVEGRIVSICHVHRPQFPRIRHNGDFAISVAQSHWGIGIGKRMCEATLAQARKVGVTKLNLYVRTDHAVAIRLYESVGFREEGVVTRALKIDGEYFDHLLMGIWLD